MIEKMQRLLKGYVRIQVKSQSYERFLNLCAARQFLLWDLEPRNGLYEMNISVKDFRQLRPLAKKCGAHICIIRKKGAPFFLYAHRHRKFLAAGLFFGIALMFFLSAFIWNIEISGNQTETTEKIFEYLKQEAVYFGTPKQQIDCKALSADLRRKFHDFTWVSAKIKGTSLLIEVKENNMETAKGEEAYPVSDLVSDRNGTVVSIITRKGTPMVKEGDRVHKGDVLVSGVIPILNDEKEVTGYRYCGADADIQLQTVYTYEEQFPLIYEKKVYSGQVKKGWYFRFKEDSFMLKPKNIPYETYDILTQENQLGFSRYFKLPLYYGEIVAREYDTEQITYSRETATLRMKAKIEENLKKIQEQGIQILEQDLKVTFDKESCMAKGSITLVQSAGKRVLQTEREPVEESTEET